MTAPGPARGRGDRLADVRRWCVGRVESLVLGASMAVVVFALERQLQRTLARRQPPRA